MSTNNTNEANTAPLAIGTAYIEAINNPNINFVAAVVELNEAEGIQFFYEGYEEGVISYSYAYPENVPISETQTKSYALPVYTHDPGILHPIEGDLPVLQVEIVNQNNTDEKKKGDVITAEPVRLDDPMAEEDEPRCLVFNTSGNNESEETEYFIFVIARTNTNNAPHLETQDGGVDDNTLVCSYRSLNNITLPIAGPIAAIAFRATEINAYTHVELEGNLTEVDYNETIPFQYIEAN